MAGDRPRVGLVLGGGGFKGAYQVGGLDALQRLPIPIHVVCGVSIGAVHAAMIAQGEISLLRDLWLSIKRPEDIFQRWPWHKLPFKQSIYSSEPLRRLIEKYVRPDKVKSSPIKLYVGAVCLQTGELRYFDNSCDNLREALLASCALPPAFEPVTIDGLQYVDGGVVHNLPIKKAIEEDCDQIIVMKTSPRQIDQVGTLTSPWKIGKRCLKLLIHARDQADLEVGQFMQKASGAIDPAS